MVGSIDVVVVAYNSRDALRECVEPLCDRDGVAVTVVDNASPDDSLAAVAGLPVDAIRLASNGGFGHGCNVGWRRGHGDYVLFLNPDARIAADSLQRLAAVLEEDSDVGIVGPRIVDEDGSLEYSIRRFPRLSSTYAQALFLHRVWWRARWADEVVRDAQHYNAPSRTEWLSGACLLVRRSLLEVLDGFDERFFMYCEDKDLCRRAWTAGFVVRFEPAAEVVHVGGGGGSGPRGELLPVLAVSRVRYARKHAGAVEAMAERVGVALSSLTHALLGRRGGTARRGHIRAFVAALTDT